MHKFIISIEQDKIEKLESLFIEHEINFYYDINLSTYELIDTFGVIIDNEDLKSSDINTINVEIVDSSDKFTRIANILNQEQMQYKLVEKTVLNEIDYQEDYELSVPEIYFDNFRIIAPWHDKNDNDIVILPGTGFGTGNHPTTKLCIEQLTKINLVGKTVLYFGAGSGILSFVSALFQAKDVISVEIDNMAIASFENNISMNNFNNISILREIPETIFNVSIMNLTYEIITRFFDKIFSLTDEVLIISGIYQGQEKHFSKFLNDKKVTYYKCSAQDWHCFVVRKETDATILL